jgi:ubiquinone/menaquinone biosynthesis C-methylase UbiE
MKKLDTQQANHKQAVASAFGSLAKLYDMWYNSPIGKYVWQVETAALTAMLPPQIKGTALDIGVGTGMSMKFLVDRGAESVGIDLSGDMLKIAKNRFKEEVQTHFVCADAEFLPFRRDSFDIILGMTVIEFIPDQHRVLKNLNKTLTPHGTLVLGILSSASIWSVERRLRSWIRPDVFSYAQFLSPWLMKKLLHKTGFGNVKYQGSVYAPTFTPKLLLPKIIQLDLIWGTRWLSRSLGAFLVFSADRLA